MIVKVQLKTSCNNQVFLISLLKYMLACGIYEAKKMAETTIRLGGVLLEVPYEDEVTKADIEHDLRGVLYESREIGIYDLQLSYLYDNEWVDVKIEETETEETKESKETEDVNSTENCVKNIETIEPLYCVRDGIISLYLNKIINKEGFVVISSSELDKLRKIKGAYMDLIGSLTKLKEEFGI